MTVKYVKRDFSSNFFYTVFCKEIFQFRSFLPLKGNVFPVSKRGNTNFFLKGERKYPLPVVKETFINPWYLPRFMHTLLSSVQCIHHKDMAVIQICKDYQTLRQKCWKCKYYLIRWTLAFFWGLLATFWSLLPQDSDSWSERCEMQGKEPVLQT